jgi:deoxyribodipyrimidine photo-lyase
MGTTLWWLRRDLRLEDNQALHAALRHGTRVVPVFVLDPVLLASPYSGDKRLAFLYDGLRALDAELRRRGSYLVVRHGSLVESLSILLSETGAEAIYAEGDVSPYATRRDAAVARALPLQLTGGLTVHPPEGVRKADGGSYTVYTPYSRAWKALPMPARGELLPAPDHLDTPAGLSTEPIPPAPHPGDAARVKEGFPAGEAEAHRRLTAFTEGPIHDYAERRDRVDLSATSSLSPYLRFGMISARRVVVAALEARDGAQTAKGAESWLNELIWREFYISILAKFPAVRRQSFREAYRRLRWDNDPEAFAAWQEGRTGYPVVDAAMRQLLATGWMHNRARMIVASFLTKDLLIDWRWGERHFMQHLIDGDPAANNGGWQWTAGTGTDAAPYFRIFNPVSQGERHDPEGTYIRRWVPELARVPSEAIHQPWRMSPEVQAQAGCVIGPDYPAPIVDHKAARERTLAAYAQARERA